MRVGLARPSPGRAKPIFFPHPSSHVDLHVPKLFLSSTYDLGDILRDRGIADFSGISQEGRLKVSASRAHLFSPNSQYK